MCIRDRQYTIRQIPANILLSADGKILAKDLKGEKLKKKIEEVVSAAEEKAVSYTHLDKINPLSLYLY